MIQLYYLVVSNVVGIFDGFLTEKVLEYIEQAASVVVVGNTASVNHFASHILKHIERHVHWVD